MITPYNPSRGIDLYADSSGEDDWDLEIGKYYLHGLMLCAPSDDWIQWMEIHETEYDGMIHWSDGTYGKQKQKLKDVKGRCRELLSAHPWFQTAIFVIDKKSFKEFFSQKYGRDLSKCEASKSLWQTMGASLLSTIIPHMKQLVPDDPWGYLNVRKIIINNPKGGDKSAIERIIKAKLGRIPEFVPAGHYGIDALDGVLWAFQRYLNLGKADCLPASAHSFAQDLGVFLFGIVSGKPVLLRNLDDIEKFKATR
jgi:hypothetical protein